MFTPISLRFSALGCTRGDKRLFNNVNCEVNGGQWLYVAGVNGVGKTSLLRMVVGLAPIESGQILWNDVSIHSRREEFRRDLCYLGHLNALQESMPVHDNLRYTAALAGLSPSIDEIDAVLARFGVPGRGQQLVRHLSQGQKRRVALSRLALNRARLWVLDEPFVAMDDAGVRMLAALIAQHVQKGNLAVITSHQQVDIGGLTPQRLELTR